MKNMNNLNIFLKIQMTTLWDPWLIAWGKANSKTKVSIKKAADVEKKKVEKKDKVYKNI